MASNTFVKGSFFSNALAINLRLLTTRSYFDPAKQSIAKKQPE